MSAPRFLIDENLSPALADAARHRGFEAMHVNHLGLRTETDWSLLKLVTAEDWMLVTNNVIEFRGRYRDIHLHPGVVFIVPVVRRQDQVMLFMAALEVIETGLQMVNRVVEVTLGPDRHPVAATYDLP